MSPRRGLSLVELLVVISIIALLIALLIPALMSSREAARRTVCRNHLKQLALAALNYEAGNGRLPDWASVEVNLGRTADVINLSWINKALPHMEGQLIPLSVAGTSLNIQRIRSLAETPLETLYCPSRRSAESYPWTDDKKGVADPPPWTGILRAAKSDYAGNDGHAQLHLSSVPKEVKFRRTGRVIGGNLKSITDGTSKTYLVGEKSHSPLHYTTGGYGDGGSYLIQFGRRWPPGPEFAWNSRDPFDEMRHTLRTASLSPARDFIPQPRVRDRRVVTLLVSFGAAHQEGWNVAMCDGSVRSMDYLMSRLNHARYGNPTDGQPVSIDLQ